MLDEVLPKADMVHREEVLDILSLARQRASMYMNEYGVNEPLDG